MLNKSLLLGELRSGAVARQLRKSRPALGQGAVYLQAAQKHISSSRTVTTTPPSKRQQVARREEQENHHQDGELMTLVSARGQALMSSEKFQARLEQLNLWHSVDTIKRLGHRLVALDPLGLSKPEQLREVSWSHALVEQMKSNRSMVETNAFLNTNQPVMAVNELLEAVWSIYTSNECGLEFAHMSSQQEVEWLTSQWERLNEFFHLSAQDEHNLAKLLLECEAFDHFMASKFPSTKRYGCEGAEPMLVVFDEILRLCHLGESELDELTASIGRIDHVIIGMPHRGRLNLLACLLGFEPAAIFAKAMGESELDQRKAWLAKGDVLSHLSTNTRFAYGQDRQHIGLWRDTPEPINVSLLANPSHLELAAPLVVGSARGRAHNLYHGYAGSPKFAEPDQAARAELGQHARRLQATKRQLGQSSHHYQRHLPAILPVQVHGDASVAGQGVVQETLQMANLPMFSVGGSLHLIVNNQIGYTTSGEQARSSRYCSDVFKSIEAPIIHVNAQNIASVIRATRLALTYRQTFGKDVCIDLVCYRQHGHNELDEPAFTQPLMYERVRKRSSIPQQYCDKIALEEAEREQIVADFKSRLQLAYKRAPSYKPDNDNYRNFSLPTEYHRDHVCSWHTGCSEELLREIALASVSTPQDFEVHPTLKRALIDERQSRFQNKEGAALSATPVDWACAELLAFGSLLKQNHTVRLAGQDVARGTFSTRHAALFDQRTNQAYIPLNNMPESEGEKEPRAQLELANTILSEEAALAYEFAYSCETSALTLWEAQFGDFFNTAQSVIDTLISSSESKWLKGSALTLLLPHGLDGAGPEHSSAHLERFLQLSSSSEQSIDTEAKVNWSIAFPTLPHQYFHLLRRQKIRPFRKPLVVMAPKSIFRHPECSSALHLFGPDHTFAPVLDDPQFEAHQAARNQVDTVVLCSGKIYFALAAEKRRLNMDNVALVRLEELCPFPAQALIETIRRYPNAHKEDIVWLQEEHRNQGAYSFVERRLQNLANIKPRYVGRSESELPATGCTSTHKKELDLIMKQFQALKR